MLNIHSRRLHDEQGFTLIELIVVILIIGILAAIALPNFLGQRGRALDVVSKSDVRNLYTHVEACYTDTQDYTKCDTATPGSLGTGLGISLGTGPGQAKVVPSAADGYVITGYSKTGSQFSITKTSGTWAISRSCVLGPGMSNSGCPGGTW